MSFESFDLAKICYRLFQKERWQLLRLLAAASVPRYLLGALLGIWVLEISALAQTDPTPGNFPKVPATIDDLTLSRKLRNPITSLVNLPLVDNYDFGGGPNRDGMKSTLNIEPIIPFPINERWKLVSRLTVPIIDQRNIVPGSTQDGFGDTVERLLLSPAKANAQGVNWGVGTAFLLPTASTSLLGYDRWCAGPATALNWHQGPWTASMLAYEVISVAGGGVRNVNVITIQPSVSYVFPCDTTLTLSSDSNFDWPRGQYTCPINTTAYQLVKIGDQPMSIGLGVRYYLSRPGGAAQWGLRCSLTFPFEMPH